jgi:hypothetical protein
MLRERVDLKLAVAGMCWQPDEEFKTDAQAY